MVSKTTTITGLCPSPSSTPLQRNNWRQWRQPTYNSYSPSSTTHTLRPTCADHCVSYTDRAKAKQQDSGAFGQKSDGKGYRPGCQISTTATRSHHRSAPGRSYATSAPTQKGDSTASNFHKQAAQKALKVVLRKRRLQTPTPSKPIFVQPLMHPSFTSNLRTFLKQAISKHKDHITPFFIPSTRPVFTKHRTMKDIIHNWREAHRRWHPEHPEACTCKPFKEKFPDNLHDGHIAIELCKVAPDVPCLEYSGKSNVLPDQKTLASQLRKAIQRWRRSNGLPVPKDEETGMINFIQQQLAQHQQHAKNTLNIHMLKALQERLPAGIIHCEDHFADRLIWYCPQLYHKCITGTFMNAETSEHQPLLLHEATYQRMLKRLPKHKGAFPNWGRIPTAYVLPKRKKDFAMGRPIVSFVQAQGRLLWESFADVLSLKVRQACPDALGEGSRVIQLHQIKQHFRSLSERTQQEDMMRDDVTCVNQDLAGFFTSISSDRFVDSYHLLLHWYQQRNTRHATTFTVAHSESLPDARVHRGHTNTHRMQPQHGYVDVAYTFKSFQTSSPRSSNSITSWWATEW